ncbi:amyloid-beta A4 precursor protein-binding family A member 1-like [Eucyclogobius newberryi]|uniref:amyloid-beta A4 precursor protein-binding family A member 1-like n=1 Tax=Eucyclogobius newberryi TaxID=166745 RepID=UPI003B5AE8AD
MSQRSEGLSPGEMESPALNGTSQSEPVRRSWRPCQMLNQDGEVVHLHQHPHPAPHHRSRRRPHHQQTAPVHRQDPAPPAPNPAPHPRPAVTRYRRHGDPNPRLRARQRQPNKEEPKEASDTPRAEVPQSSQNESQTDESQSSTSIQTPGGDECPCPTPKKEQRDRGGPAQSQPTEEESNQQPEGVQQSKVDSGEEPGPQEVQLSADQSTKPEDKTSEQDIEEEPCGFKEGLNGPRVEFSGQREELSELREEPCGPGEVLRESMEGINGQMEGPPGAQMEGPPGAQSEGSGAQKEGPGAERKGLGTQREGPGTQREGPGAKNEGPGAQREGPGAEREGPGEATDDPAQESEITDLCSDTESVASLSLDGPLHSPPPLHSPTPPSSPDVPHFPQIDHFSEGPHSPPPTLDTPPGDSDKSDTHPEDEDDEDEAVLPPYPQTYADFYSQSHQKSYPEPKQHPNSFPEPLRTAYPAEPPKSESRSRPDHVHKSSHHAQHHRPVQNLPLDSSIGCRLHHYDGQSDGESSNQSPVSRGPRQAGRRGDPGKRAPAGHKCSGVSLGDPPEDRTPGDTGPKGDAISLAIRGIKEAIEEVKTRAVRSPYTPDQPVEPVWVMRQESSPTEEAGSVGQVSPGSPCDSLYSSSVQDPVSPMRAEASRTYPHTQRDTQRQSYPPNPGQQRAAAAQPQPLEMPQSLPSFPTFVDVPGPCDPDDLIDGIIFAATYLGCTHLLSERTPSKSARMQQAQEAMSRVRAAQKQAKNRKKGAVGDSVSTVEVDLFMSTQRIKVLNADTQESLMDLPLRTISYIADIGNMVVLMARGKMVRSRSAQDQQEPSEEQSHSPDHQRVYKMICHVFESEDAQLIAQSIGQSFSVAYQEFLRANGIDPEDLSQREYSDLLSTQDMYNEDLIHFSKSENCRDVYIEKQKGEVLGVVIVESGWGSILPTVIIASMMHSGPAEKSGRLNIGDQIMTVNGTSLVGLPLSTCQSIIKGLKSQCRIKMNIVRCPPVTMVLIRRPDLRYQLGFSVQNGIICSLMRGGIAERGGVRVGHRIIEINSQSVVATPHEKIVQILSNAMGEIHMKTMPAAMYRLLTAQEQPVYI